MKTINSRPAAPSLALERFRWLPLRPNVWQLGHVRLPTWTDYKVGWPYRSLMAICRSAASGALGSSEPFWPGAPVGAPSLEAIAHLATQDGMAYRPRHIEVADAHLADAIRDRLEDLGIELLLVSHITELDEAAATIRQRCGGLATSTPYFDPSVGIGVLRAFADAADELQRAPLWNHVKEVDLIQVVSPRAPEGMSHFHLISAAGQPKGVLFFATAEAREQALRKPQSDPRNAETGLWSLQYVDVMQLPLADSELWEAHELPFVAYDAYPVLRRQLARTSGPASREHLELAEALCRALAATTEDELDAGRWSKTVRTRGGVRTVELLMPATAAVSAAATAAASSESPVDQAADLIERAIACHGRPRIKLAREAIRRWPDCASGYLLQGEAMPDCARRAELYRLAYEASERVLGPDALCEDARAAWATPESRRYFHARREMAECYWQLGRRDEALQHWYDLLLFDPRDVRRVRDILVPRLLEAFEDERAAELLLEYEHDASALLTYARALQAYGVAGESPEALRLLRLAIERNPHAPQYLLNREELSGPIPEGPPAGSDAEARFIAHLLHGPWYMMPGAPEWLEQECRPAKRSRGRKAGAS